MKWLSTLLLLISVNVHAQYNAGVYVTDTLYSGVYGSIAFCTPNPDVTLTADSTLFTNVTGLDYQFIVTGVSAPGIGTQLTGPFVVGDTLPLSPGVEYPIFFPNGGTLNYILQAYGTPQIVNELYYCDVAFLFTLGFCDNYAYFYPDSTGSQCLVGSVGVEETNSGSTIMYPNPAAEQVYLGKVKFGSEYSVIDINGREVLHGFYGNEGIHIIDLPAGMYAVLTGSRGHNSGLRFIKLEYE